MPPYVKNAKSGTTGKRSHHCAVCNGPVKQRCIGPHVEYCHECGHIYALKHGCFEHGYSAGYNLAEEAAFKRRPKNRIVEFFSTLGKKKEEEPEEEEPEPAYDTDWRAPEGKKKYYRPKVNKDEDNEDDGADGKQNAPIDPPKQKGKKGAKIRRGAQTAAN
ncbi:hypothetical protein BU16DRAFT_563207 [Lophium mytilinum]|uniref:Uncharacterized protein n=1 Tax=Lophium mytilinum TaxID=390894 RepID=A0A6A6QPI8_9PEZI|nr:hypothetical protein BU16DRAFT_563207 [Lophium mytilinum]